MPVRSQEDQQIVQARLLYTALIKAVLIAWGRGFSVANPHRDPFALSDNKQAIIDAIVEYFEMVPAESTNGLVGSYVSDQTKLEDSEQQIAPMEELYIGYLRWPPTLFRLQVGPTKWFDQINSAM